MIYLLHGSDSYRLRRRLREIREALGPDATLGSNASMLDGASLSPAELLAHASAAPFLADARLVIVEGLVAALTAQRGGRRAGRAKEKADDDPLVPWEHTADQLAGGAMPPSTTLIFLEGAVDMRARAFKLFERVSAVERFDPLNRRETASELAEWIARIAAEQGVTLTGRAMATLTQLSGGDLWAVETELAKLAAYAAGEPVDPEMLTAASSFAQETKVWELTDGILAGDETKALTAMRRLLSEGEAAQLLLWMITRQFRQLVIAKDMRERGMPAKDIETAAGLPSFRVGPTQQIASRYPWQALRDSYERLLAADLNTKRGLTDVEQSLQLVISELCALAPAPSRTPARR